MKKQDRTYKSMSRPNHPGNFYYFHINFKFITSN